MSYQFAIENTNYEDLSSGRVLYNQHGTTAFPVRLASEIFQRSKFHLSKKGNTGPYRIYDPCCGGGYLLTTLGFLHSEDIDAITASDIDSKAVELAQKNFFLLGEDGLNNRIDQLKKLYHEYGKESHKAALESADRLKMVVKKIPNVCFEADITRANVVNEPDFDLIITDLPYGQIVDWRAEASNPIEELLGNLIPCLGRHSLVVIVSTKYVSVRHKNYVRIGSFKIGKRKVTFLELENNTQSIS